MCVGSAKVQNQLDDPPTILKTQQVSLRIYARQSRRRRRERYWKAGSKERTEEGGWATCRLDVPLRPTVKLTLLLLARKMGAYKYIGELYKKKQSDVLRFLLRVRCVANIRDVGGSSVLNVPQVLGVPPVERHPPCLPSLPPGQGSPSWLQG